MVLLKIGLRLLGKALVGEFLFPVTARMVEKGFGWEIQLVKGWAVVLS